MDGRTDRGNTRFAWAGGTLFLVVLYVVSVFGSGGKKVLGQFWYKYVFTTQSTIQLCSCVIFVVVAGGTKTNTNSLVQLQHIRYI